MRQLIIYINIFHNQNPNGVWYQIGDKYALICENNVHTFNLFNHEYE